MTADQNSTIAAIGLKTTKQLPIKYGQLASGILQSSAFSFTIRNYAFIAVSTPCSAQVLVNGTIMHHGPWPTKTYSLFRPQDRIECNFQGEPDCEVLSLCPALLHKFIDDEFSENADVLLDSCIGQDMPVAMQSIWKRIRLNMSMKNPQSVANIEMCVELLIAKLVEQSIASTSALAAGGNLAAVSKAAHHIQRNLSNTLDLKTIANAAGLSPFYFSRVFKAVYGVTVHRYVLERRLELASRLLKQDALPISRISLEAGFSSQSHMTTAFRLHTGLTPSAFRQLSARDNTQSEQSE